MSNKKKAPKTPDSKPVEPKLKKIKTGIKGGVGVSDPCNNRMLNN